MRTTALSSVLAAAVMAAFPAPSFAQSYVAQDVWYSTLYGGAIGGVAGAGVMLLTGDPLDNSEYVVTGVGAGILGGLAYGIYSYSGANNYGLVNVRGSGATHYAVPKPRPFISRQGERATVGLKMDVVRGRF